ncbi:MAG: ferrous iron transport protein A [Cellulosilyticum sp.]|nr:ferrous iron transport protein A [Cellulosilyticum sp.]
MTLSEGVPSTVYHVLGVQVDPSIERRLAALGLISGTNITLLNKKKRGAVIFSVRGTRFAIGKVIADGILVEVAE